MKILEILKERFSQEATIKEIKRLAKYLESIDWEFDIVEVINDCGCFQELKDRSGI